ncbi:uncharacterized protein LY89DRAFT_685400 [Mollisia scopiformis]|uniref:Protein kinase domain-containing protein n=1 Tax=Mollisia scopiformis TaxID=149040 RepID=A0A194X8A9_MOLSC|nr:uncharacterized protein LY89DRAFT_685400 [Mollisia scopiformis]KUJ16408.1 hypothetical protein LY89DRAFT_685400 [Mollisia scopiformis]
MPVKDLTEEPPSEISQALLVEARIYESFRDLPHPHILQYKGCVVRDGRIVALALPKLPETLGARIEDETRPIDGVKVYEEVSAGLRYLHSLGLAHNDIAPSNIMLREDDTAVIIDFGSCAKEGEATSGTVSVGWSLNGPKSEKRKDKHALEVLKKYLEDPLHRDPFHQYEEI